MLTPYLENEYGLSVAVAGLGFATSAVSGAICSPILGKLCQMYDRRYVLLGSIGIGMVAKLLIAPVY